MGFHSGFKGLIFTFYRQTFIEVSNIKFY